MTETILADLAPHRAGRDRRFARRRLGEIAETIRLGQKGHPVSRNAGRAGERLVARIIVRARIGPVMALVSTRRSTRATAPDSRQMTERL